MTTHAIDEIDEWDSSQFSGGYRGLQELADADFSGIVRVGRPTLCMLNGTVVGILEGDIDDFEGASGTAYESPSPALPVLAIMQDRADEVRAKYYTEDTPISEVDDTLSDGGFTGYIELSENVLSGDYYVVYHDGRSMAVAWVGNSGQLLTDDEAFDRADGEVGIYKVRPADLDPIAIPEPSGSEDAAESAGAAGAGAAAAAGGAAAADAEDAGTDAAGSDDATADDAGTAGGSGAEAAGDGSSGAGPAAGSAAGAAGSDGTATGTGQRGATETTTDAARAETGTAAEQTTEGDRVADDDTGTADAGATAEESGAADTGATADASPDADGQRDAASQRSERRERGDDRRGASSTGAQDGSGRARSADAGGSGTAGAATGASATNGNDSGGATGGGRPEGTGTAHAAAGAAGTTDPDELETRSLPSLDPSRTSTPGNDVGTAAAHDAGSRSADPADPGGGQGRAGESPAGGHEAAGTAGGEAAGSREGTDTTRRDRDARSTRDTRQNRDARQERESRQDVAGRTGSGGNGASTERIAELESELEEREAEIERLETELDETETDLHEAEADAEDLRDELAEVRSERDDLRERIDDLESDREELRAERDDLRDEVAELEQQLDRKESEVEEIEEEFGAATDADQRLTPGEALDQTNIFVRYESKGQPTLEAAHGGSAAPDQVNENLDLEYHTQFDKAAVSVGGQTFEEFLHGTIQYRFVNWVIRTLIYEIRSTGTVAALQDLYDAIPRIDRAQLNGEIQTQYTEDGQERSSTESFDVVLRDRMGNPLVVANLNDSRQAATESMMSSLVTASSHVGESTDTLAASFFVTSSFFEPEALETTSSATSGGLLSRDKRESFVKLSRKQGYHLCLVESREEKFHLAVPEL